MLEPRSAKQQLRRRTCGIPYRLALRPTSMPLASKRLAITALLPVLLTRERPIAFSLLNPGIIEPPPLLPPSPGPLSGLRLPPDAAARPCSAAGFPWGCGCELSDLLPARVPTPSGIFKRALLPYPALIFERSTSRKGPVEVADRARLPLSTSVAASRRGDSLSPRLT